MKTLKDRIDRTLAWVKSTFLWGVWDRYTTARGPLLSRGLAYQAIFASFAAVWVAFAIAGLIVSGDDPLRDAVIDILATAVPGLIDTGSGGAIDPSTLLSASVLGWTGAFALLILGYTAIGWLSDGRDAVRTVASLLSMATNAIVLKLRDAGLALAFGVIILVSAGLSLLGSTLVHALVDWLDGPGSTDEVSFWNRAVGFVISFAFDTLVFLAFYRLVSGLHVARRALWEGALLGSFAFGVMKALGTALLGGATSNPLLAGFAVIVGLLIWFNLICQLLLIVAAWITERARRLGMARVTVPNVSKDGARPAITTAEDGSVPGAR